MAADTLQQMKAGRKKSVLRSWSEYFRLDALEVRGVSSINNAKVKQNGQMSQKNSLGRSFRVEISGARMHLSR